MLVDLLVSKSVLISEITRALGEKSSPRGTYKRLEHGLGRYDFTQVALAQTRHNCSPIGDDHVICLDGSDIAKPFAKNLEADRQRFRRHGQAPRSLVQRRSHSLKSLPDLFLDIVHANYPQLFLPKLR